MSRLTLICDGGAPFLEYFMANGIYPSYAVFDLESFQMMASYLTAEDDLLIVVHGLTDFTMSGIHTVYGSLMQNKDKFGSLTVLSDLPLSIDGGYFLYSGDLFYGSVKYVGPDKKEYAVKDGQPTKTLASKEGKRVSGGNSVMRRFAVYNNPRIKTTLHGENYLRAPFQPTEPVQETVTDSVVAFDRHMPVPFQVSSDTK